MEFGANVLAVIFSELVSLTIFAASVTFLFLMFFDSVGKIFYNITKKTLFLHYSISKKTLSPENKIVLHTVCRYYRSLPNHLQPIFEHRVARFCKAKTFFERDGFELNEAKKVHIASVAITLTFGYRYYNYSAFKNIHVFPEEYFSRRTGNYHAGETGMNGYVSLSWNNFLWGEEDANDNLNLGLHEFAHALFLNEASREENYPFSYWIDDWYRIMNRLKPIIQKMELFREYAFTNNMEFFAVATEHFFETPENLKKKMPNAYNIMCKLLNQDPLTIL